MILRPEKQRGLEVFIGRRLCWQLGSGRDSRSGLGKIKAWIQNYVCRLPGPMEVNLAKEESSSRCTRFSCTLRDAIPIMNLFKEMKEVGMPIDSAKAKVHCKVLEDNTGALEMARVHEYRPRTKHSNCRSGSWKNIHPQHRNSSAAARCINRSPQSGAIGASQRQSWYG